MHLRTLLTSLVVAIAALAAPVASIAHGYVLHEQFDDRFSERWHFFNFEDLDGVFNRSPGVLCGEDACGELLAADGDGFLRVSVRPTTTAGVYTNQDITEVPIGFTGAIETGRWNPRVGRPIVLRTRVRWNSAYGADGSGAAVGTSGVVLWNSAVDEVGPTPEYDQIGFTWLSARTLGGFVSGLTGSTFVNQQPLVPLRPAAGLDIHDWMKLKMVWRVDSAGVQSVEYFVNRESIGVTVLPEALRNLSVEIWNDNQEPTFTPDGLANEFPAPSVEQSFDLDKVVVRARKAPRQ